MWHDSGFLLGSVSALLRLLRLCVSVRLSSLVRATCPVTPVVVAQKAAESARADENPDGSLLLTCGTGKK
jgi:hypothetical protein